jgi:hypothetical protein
MGPIGTGTLDEAYQRLHATGPEFAGWLSNHGPQARSCRVPGLTASRRTGAVDSRGPSC